MDFRLSMEKFAKSIEILRVYLTDKNDTDRKDEKILHLTIVTDFVCDFNDNRIQDFSQVLATVIEVILVYCGDTNSDVRSNAAECLEKISKAKINFYFKILANIFKELKRCENPRSLKAALSHIADLVPYLQPQKFYIIQASFGQEISRLAVNENEAVLETLPVFIDKVYSIVGCGLNHKDVSAITLPFLGNLGSKNAVSRRSASLAIYHLCRHSALPIVNTLHAMKNILSKILPLNQESLGVDSLVGSLICLRHLLSIIDAKKCSFELENASSLIPILTLCFEVCCHLCKHASSVVKTAALEALLALLKMCPFGLKRVLTRRGGIPREQINDNPEDVLSWSPTETLTRETSASGLASSFQNLEDNARADVPLFTNKLADRKQNVESAGSVPSGDQMTSSIAGSTASSMEDIPEKIRALTTKDDLYAKQSEENVDQNEFPDLVSDYMTESYYGSPENQGPESGVDIGTYSSNVQTPATYALRLICSDFLLAGEKSKLKPDNEVRVSIKCLALQIVAQLCALEDIKDLQIFLSASSNSEAQIQFIDDVYLFATHADPQVRSGCVNIYGAIVKSFLEGLCLEAAAFPRSIEALIKAISDPEAPVVRSALTVLASNIQLMMEICPHSALLVDIIEAVLFLKSQNYWLIKLSALEFLQNVDFNNLLFHEANCSYKSSPEFSLQNQILQFVAEQIQSSNQNLRDNASKILATMVEKICLPMSNTFTHSHESLVNFSTNLHSKYCPSFKPIPEIYAVDKSMHFQKSYSRIDDSESATKLTQKLSFVINMLFNSLNEVNDPNALNGILQTLRKLSQLYEPRNYPSSWQMCPTPERSDMNSSEKFGNIKICLNLLSSSFCTNVVTHAYLLDIVTSLLTSTVIGFLENPQVFDDSMKAVRDWPAISDEILSSLFGTLFHHLLKCLNVVDHVLRNKEPATSPVKSGYPKLPTNLTSLPSYFPNTATIPSPIRKKGQKLVETAVTKARNTNVTLPSLPTKFLEEAKKESISMFTSGSSAPSAPTPPKPLDSSFSHDSNLMLLFEILSSMNRSLKVSSLTSQNDKFIIFTSSVLSSIGSLFHYASTREISLYVDTILRQVELCLNLTPVKAITCVQNLFHSVFGTSVCHNPAQLIDPGYSGKTRRERDVMYLYTSTFTDPYMRFTQDLAPDASSNGDPSQVNLKRELKQKTGRLGQFQNRMPLVNQHIKSFESLVLNSLRKYSSSSRPCDRLLVIELLCQLINLKVNYNLLDNEHSFLKFLSDQLAVFSELRGELAPFHSDLMGHAMSFFIQLSHQKYEGKPIIYLEKITQHCSALSKVDNKVSISVLRPVVHDLFARRGISINDPEEQLATSNNLETSGSKAARQIISVLLLQLSDYPEAWDLVIVALRHAKHEGEMQHKTFSRQCSDNIVPLLENGEINFETVLDIERLQMLVCLLHPSVGLINSENLLRLFFKPPPTDSLRNFKNFLSILTSLVNVMCRQSQDESFLSKVKEVKTRAVSDSSPLFKCEKPGEMIANQILHVVSTLSAFETFDFDINQVAPQIFKFLQHLQFLIKSSSPLAKKIAESFARLINGAQISYVLSTNVITMNEKLKRLLVPFHPYIFLQWCDILFSVGYTKDHSWWPSILNSDSSKASHSPSQTLLIKSCFLLLVDSAVATANKDTEPMSWVILNHLRDVCILAEEPPVSDFLGLVYQQPALSALFVQKLQDDLIINSIVNSSAKNKFLTVVKALHPTISHKVLLLLCANESLINNSDLVFQRGVVNIVIAKLQHLANSTTCDQPPIEDLDLVARRLYPMKFLKKFPDLIDQLSLYFQKLSNENSQFLKDGEILKQSQVLLSDFESFDVAFTQTFLTKNRDKISNEDHSKFIYALDLDDAMSYLSGSDNTFGLIVCLYQRHLNEQQSQNNAPNIQLVEFISDIFVAKTKRFLSKLNESSDGLNSLEEINVFMNCLEHFLILNASWIEKLAPFGGLLLNMVQVVLEYYTINANARPHNCLDLVKFLQFVPNVAVLTQIVEKGEPGRCLKLCKLLMLLTRNIIPDCFPTSKVPQKDDDVVTIRESSECVLLLHAQNPSNELASYLKNAFASLCRHPDLIEVCRVPKDMWSKGFSVESIKDRPPNMDASFLLDPDIFYDFQTRVEVFGWVSRQSFEEIWMIYLSVLNSSNEEEIDLLEEKWKIRKMSFNAIISLVAVAMRTLLPGNPSLVSPGIPFSASRTSKFNSGRRVTPEIHYASVAKLKRQLTSQFKGVVKSSSVHFAELLSQSVFAHLPESVVEHVKVDLNSCVVLLNEQCHHWLTDSTIPTSVTCDVFKGLILLSNLFVDTNQFDWLYVLISNLHRTLPPEDELTALYTIPLLCQSINATTDIERHAEEIDHLISIFVSGLNSSMLSIETTTLCGLSLLMKCAGKNQNILRPIVTNHIQLYILNRITAATSVAASRPSQHYMLSLVALTFDTITNFITELRDSEFVSTAVQMFLVYSNICTKNVFCAIFTRIDELVISQSLNRKVADFVIKTCFEHIKNASTKTMIRFSLSLLLSCIYSYYPPAVHNLESDENISIDSIERVTRIIEKFEFSSAQHALIIVRPLGRLMIDYLNLHERFYKATSLLQKHRSSFSQSCCAFLVFEIFQDLIKTNSEKVLFELLWPPLPSIITPLTVSEDACNIISLMFISAIESPFAEPMVSLVLNQIKQKLTNHSTAHKSSYHVQSWSNWVSVIQELCNLSARILNAGLDCEADRVQLKESLQASKVKFIRDIPSSF